MLKKEFHWDKGLLLTTRHLMTQPGTMIKGYLAGKRIQYTKPLSYLFLVVAASLLLYTKEDLFDRNPLVVKQDSKPELQNAIFDWIFGHMALVILGMIPFISLVSKWLYKKAKLHYAEHFVLNTYTMAGMTLLGILVNGLGKILGFGVKSVESMALSMSLSSLYFAWIYVEVFNTRHRWHGGLKAASTCLLGYLLYLLFAMVVGIIGTLVYLLVVKRFMQ